MIFQVHRQRKIWFTLSLLFFGLSIVFLALGGLQLGTDFTGGSLMQVSFQERAAPSIEDLEQALSEQGTQNPRIQSVDLDSVIIRTKQLTGEEHASLLDGLQQQFGTVLEESYSEVGPTLGKELQQKAITAIALVLIGIILYVSWAFRKSSGRLSGWAFGVMAIVTLIHDVTITAGVFAFLGYFYHVEIDALFVTALLTVLGFSVHDTIVVFDRIREGLRKHSEDDLVAIIDQSVSDTLIRSINTSLTILLVLFALFFFGGASIHYFVLALIVGIVVGVYSSIFVASPLLLYWKRR